MFCGTDENNRCEKWLKSLFVFICALVLNVNICFSNPEAADALISMIYWIREQTKDNVQMTC